MRLESDRTRQAELVLSPSEYADARSDRSAAALTGRWSADRDGRILLPTNLM